MTDIERKRKISEYRHAYYCDNELKTNTIYANEEKKGQKWTKDECNFLLNNQEMTHLQASRILGRTCMSIRNKRQRLGLLAPT